MIADGGPVIIVDDPPELPAALWGLLEYVSMRQQAMLFGFGGSLSGKTARSSQAGYWLHSGAALHIENCTVVERNGASAISFMPVGGSELYISDSVISDNRGATGGILIKPTGSGYANVVLDNVNVENNRFGVQVDGTGSTAGVNVALVNSVVSGNSGNGVAAPRRPGKRRCRCLSTTRR